ncbi:translation elongation factor EF-1, subunit alpha [Aspergillus tubingensis]|uniref:translation elongation factor EF-1, subunit alpha n=1 Tax=Aspergillus tubingensis TaxID=5068 RepID=UPI001577D076|nr:translation elongation factor EF-1, subunit alpha [Aspergillus tubingensis]GFN10358.1 translation elongation factor EF-1, subunit alpha [Aspergillus tubingensis]GLA98225.1 hypothetical protein AtubIFM57143_006164 [Aspergillus tubingensis]GLB22222.1 hypothetical protein AtubIFM61612_002781 [Aspergillus tubingensis]
MANQYTFTIPLHETGNEDSAYRMTNLPNEEQRHYLIHRTYHRSDRIVKGRLQHVIHGNLHPDDHVSNATLIVAKFEFLGQTLDRRFKYARIKWDFAYADMDDDDEDGDGDTPEVRKVSLDGQYVMNESVVSLSKEVRGDAGVQGGGVVTASIGTGWTRSQSAEVKDHISIFGTSLFTNRLCGEPNGAQWVLEENASQRSGIPGAITTAVLLRRDPGRVFVGTIEVKAEMGRFNKIEDWLGKKPRVDPVVFNPALPPTTKVYDAQHLDAVDLDAIPAVVLHTSLPVAQ